MVSLVATCGHPVACVTIYTQPLSCRHTVSLLAKAITQGRDEEAATHLVRSPERGPGALPVRAREVRGNRRSGSDDERARRHLHDVRPAQCARYVAVPRDPGEPVLG